MPIKLSTEQDLTDHEALTDAHGATASNTASRIVSRNADGSFTISGIQLDTSATPTSAVGFLRWNDTDKCGEIQTLDGVVVQLGQESNIYARNESGGALANGKAVVVDGASGQRMTFVLADSTSLDARKTIGLVTSDSGISNNGFGFVTTFGLVRDIDTSAFVEGDELFLSTAGNYVTAKPTAESSSVVRIGWVVRSHATLGSIFTAPHFHGTVVGDAVMNATSKADARTAIGALGTADISGKANLAGGNTFSGDQIFQGQIVSTDPELGVTTITPNEINLDDGVSENASITAASFNAKAPIVSPGFTSATTSNVVTVKNTNSAGYSSVSILDLNDVERMVLGYGNTSGSAPYAGAPYIATALPLRLVNTSGGKYVDILTSSGNGELLFANTAPGANVIAMQNKTDTEGSISGIVARNAAGIEFGAFGGGGKEGSAYPFSGSVFIESSDIFAGGTNTVAPDIKIIQTYLNGSGGIVYNERMRFADQGAWTVFKSGVWPTQNRFIFTDTVGSGNIYVQPENGRIRLGYNEAVAGILDPNFGALQYIQPTATATAFTITQDLIATAHMGFAASTSAFIIGADGPTIDFRENPTGTLAGGTLRMQLNLSTGNLTVGGVNGNTITAGTGTLNLNSTSSSLTSFTGSGTSSGTNTGDQTTVSGNAGTATALQTARTINGVSFDGTANISIPSQKLTGYTVGTLPAGTIGDEAYVTDATAPTYLGALTGGGAVVCPVFYNGSAWVSH